MARAPMAMTYFGSGICLKRRTTSTTVRRVGTEGREGAAGAEPVREVA